MFRIVQQYQSQFRYRYCAWFPPSSASLERRRVRRCWFRSARRLSLTPGRWQIRRSANLAAPPLIEQYRCNLRLDLFAFTRLYFFSFVADPKLKIEDPMNMIDKVAKIVGDPVKRPAVILIR